MALYPSSSRPRTLMEQLLQRKIEQAANTAAPSVRLKRTDSMESSSSVGSLTSSIVLGEDVCRCDDCLLGIVDLYIISSEASKKKKDLAISKAMFFQHIAQYPIVLTSNKKLTEMLIKYFCNMTLQSNY